MGLVVHERGYPRMQPRRHGDVPGSSGSGDGTRDLQGRKQRYLLCLVEDPEYVAARMTGPEYQLLDDVGWPGELAPERYTSSDEGIHAPSDGKQLKPVGEWNNTRIVVNGAHVEHWLNGAKMVEFERWSDDWKARRGGKEWEDRDGIRKSLKRLGLFLRCTMNEDRLLERITVNPVILGGKPIVRGRRLAVEHVIGMLAAGDSVDDLLSAYPWLEGEDGGRALFVLGCSAFVDASPSPGRLRAGSALA